MRAAAALLGMIGAATAAGAIAQPAPVPAAKVVRERFEDLIAAAEERGAVGDLAAAQAFARRAVAAADRYRPARPERQHQAVTLLAGYQSEAADDNVVTTYERAVAIAERAFGADDIRTLRDRYDLTLYRLLAKRGGSLAELAAIADRMVAAAKTPTERTDAAHALATLADHTNTFGGTGDVEIAARAQAILDALPADTGYLMAGAYDTLAVYYFKKDRTQDCLDATERAVASYTREYGADYYAIPLVLTVGSQAASSKGDYALAERMLRRSAAIVDAKPWLSAVVRARSVMTYALFLVSTRQLDLAYPLIERGVAICEDVPPGWPIRQGIRLAAARAYLDGGRYTDAIRHLTRGIALADAVGTPTRTQGMLLLELARAELAHGDLAAADKAIDRSRSVVAAAVKGIDFTMSGVRMTTGDIAAARGDAVKAQDQYRTALGEFAQLEDSLVHRANAEVKIAAMAARLGTLDEAGWRGARQGGDAIAGWYVALAATVAAAPKVPPTLFDTALDVGWVRAGQLPR